MGAQPIVESTEDLFDIDPSCRAPGMVPRWDAAAGAFLGAASPVAAEFSQSSPASVWTIDHNLGRIPAGVSVVDSSGRVVNGGISHPSVNQTVIDLGVPFSGTVYLI